MTDPKALPVFLLDRLGPPLSAEQIDRVSKAVFLPTGQFRVSFSGMGEDIPWVWNFAEVQELLRQRVVTGARETLDQAMFSTYEELRGRNTVSVWPRITYLDEEQERQRQRGEIEEVKRTEFGQPLRDLEDAFRAASVRALREARILCFRGDTNPPQVIAPSSWTSTSLPVRSRERRVCRDNARFLLSGDLPTSFTTFRGKGCKTRADRAREAEAGELLKQILLERPRPRKDLALARVHDHYPDLSGRSLKRLWELYAPDEAKRPGAPKKRSASDG